MLRQLVAVTLVALLLFVLGYGTARFRTPVKVVTKTDTQVVTKDIIKWRTRVIKDSHEYKTVIEHKFPDGTWVRKSTDEKTNEEKRDTRENRKEDKTSNTISQTTTTYSKPNWQFGVLTGFSATSPKGSFELGGYVDRRLLGPVWIGANATKSGRVGFSLGIEF